jgi:hypothetical protein
MMFLLSTEGQQKYDQLEKCGALPGLSVQSLVIFHQLVSNPYLRGLDVPEFMIGAKQALPFLFHLFHDLPTSDESHKQRVLAQFSQVLSPPLLESVKTLHVPMFSEAHLMHPGALRGTRTR